MSEITDKVKGNLKKVIGTITRSDKLVREGERDVLKGEAKGAAKEAKKAIKDGVK